MESIQSVSRFPLMVRLACLALFLGLTGSAPDGRAETKFRTQFGVKTPMRDGVKLDSDLWLPKEPGRYPALLVRTPYVKASGDLKTSALAQFYTDHGYAFMIQDTRGRGDSEGEFHFFSDDGKDGYDTIEWMAQQPWSNGKVGMLGVSYLGTVQWLAAREHPPHLVCIAPTAPAGRYLDEVPYMGGAFMLNWAIGWINDTSGHTAQGANAADLDMNEILKHRPLLTVDEVYGRKMPLYREFVQHNMLDDYWKRIQFSEDDFKKLDIPALTTTGWFDGDQPGALFYWRNMRALSPSKDKQYLLAGPWTHGQTFLGGEKTLGEWEFSGEAIYDLKTLDLAFFDHFLKGSAPKFDAPRAHVYVTGINKWRDDEEYPPAVAQNRALYFHSGGQANTLHGDGTLSWEAARNEPTDHYTYFPEHPVPSDDNEDYGGIDHRHVERRDDVLVYTSDVMKAPLEIIGKVFVHVFAASDARDTDFTARLLDVYPDGRAILLGPEPGMIRARFRNGHGREELLTPGKTEHYRIELFDMAHTFLPGHQIRVEVSSSYFPHFDPNLNTGNPFATDTESRPAKQTIFHDGSAGSYVELPVMPN
jgi:putative CocE/NonD family hydrolase